MRRQVYSCTIASGASTSSAIDLGSSCWTFVNVQVSTMSTAAAIGMQASCDGGSSYFNVFHPTQNSSTVGTPQVFIASGVGTNGGVCQVPVQGQNNVRFVATGVVSGGVIIKVICGE